MKDLQKFQEAIADGTRAIILTHDYPDPDCLAAAWGMQVLLQERFGIPAVISFGGFVGRAENRAMVEMLRIETVAPHEIEPEQFDLWVMVDTQPRTGNSILEPDSQVDVVIDHHPAQPGGPEAVYSDIRNEVGATATIVTDYLVEFNVDIPSNLATGLFLGLKTDTQALGRAGTQLDHKYYLELFEKADHPLLARIEYPRLRPSYFRVLSRGPARARVHGPLVVSYVGEVDDPESISEMCDLLVRLEETELAMCTGHFRDVLYLSLRCHSPANNLGQLAHALVKGMGSAGGHESIAGGQVPVNRGNPEEIAQELSRRLREAMGLQDVPGQPIFIECLE